MAEQSTEAVDHAYGFVLHSYEWELQRFEAMHKRIQGIVTIAITAPVLMIPIIRSLSQNIQLELGWLIGVVAMVLVTIMGGAFALHRGDFRLPSPKYLHDHCLDLSSSDFKRRVLKHAGENLEHNTDLVRCKAWAATALAGLLIGELVLLVLWSLTGT